MATTTNYSWTTPDDTDLVKDGASAIRTLGSAIDTTVFTNAGAAVAKATVDAKGDLLVGTADNTVDRLAVGTDGFTLVADSVETTGLKWVAPSASLDNYTLINTGGTTLTGANTFTVSGISGKNSILIIADNFSTSSGNSEFRVRLNADSGSNYSQSGLQLKATATAAGLNIQNGTSFWVAQAQDNHFGTYYLKMAILGTGATGYKYLTASTFGDVGTLSQMNTLDATYKGTSAISSITFFSNSANFDSGTLFVYGA